MAIDTHSLVGREPELAWVRSLLDGDSPWTAVVAGEAGVGKTALWLAARSEAAARGFLVLSSRPTDVEAGLSFSGLADLLADVVTDVLAGLPRPRRRALEAALGLAAPDGPVNERLIAFALLDALKALAGRSPLLVAVDDLQWLDPPSLALLRYVLPRLEAQPVAVLITVRGDVPSWLRRERPSEFELKGLSLGAVFELLRTRLHGSFPRPVLLRIWETSGGNPFFALELGRALQRRGARLQAGEDLPLPPSLEGLLQERLDRLTPAALQTAQVVAAVAEPTVELVESAADEGLAEALAAGVLEVDGERLRFTHPLLASAVSARTTPRQRRSLHGRLAILVPAGEQRARHLALAASGPDPEVAATLEEASKTARARGAPTAAAELAEQALRLTPGSDSEERARRSVLAADRLMEAGDSHKAAELLESALASSPPGPGRASQLLSHGYANWGLEGPRAAVARFERALVESEGDPVVEARAHVALADVMRFVAGGSLDRGLRHAELAVEAAARAGGPELRCSALATFVLLRFLNGRGNPGGELDEALALERSLGLRTGEAAWTRGHLLAWSGDDLDGARSFLHEYRDALRAADDLGETHALWWLALVEWRSGDWEAATRHAEEFTALLAQGGATQQGLPRFVEAAVAASRGEVARARGISRAGIDEARELGTASLETLHRWVLGFVDLSLGDARAALEHLRPAADLSDELQYREPGHRVELADTVEALIALGQLDEAERRLAPWEDRARGLDRAWVIANLARCRGLLLAARRDLPSAVACFEEALEQHRRVGHPLDHGRTLLALGATQRRAKQRAAARATLEQALAVFEGLGAPLWAEQARVELARIGGRTPLRGELTESERRIAALVVEGRSNREVAAALFLTEHSVETALTRIYRKVGVRSRTELASRLRPPTA